MISEDHEAIVQDLDAVGMVAIGDFSPVALGDYAAGPSHALPDRRDRDLGLRPRHPRLPRAARTTSTSAREALGLGPHVERLARLEGFENHAASVETRMG